MFTTNTAGQDVPFEEHLTRLAMARHLGKVSGEGSVNPDSRMEVLMDGLPKHGSLDDCENIHLSTGAEPKKVLESLQGGINYDVRGGVRDHRWYPDFTVPTFKDAFVKEVVSKFPGFFDLKTLAIIADPVTNDSEFHQPELGWYLHVLDQFFPNYANMSVLVVSSDPEWARRHFGCLPYASVIEKNAVSLCMASRCRNIVTGCGWFGFWAMRISQCSGTWLDRTIMPEVVMRKPGDPAESLFHTENVIIHGVWRCDLSDVSFIEAQPYYGMDSVIPLSASFRFLEKQFKTSATLAEADCKDTHGFQVLSIDWGIEDLWHMRMDPEYFSIGLGMRYAAESCDTEILCFWDGYHAVSPVALWHAVNVVRNGELDAVIPHGVECKTGDNGLEGSSDLWMMSMDTGEDPTRRLSSCHEEFYAPLIVSRDAYDEVGGHDKRIHTSEFLHKELFLRMARKGLNVDVMTGSSLMSIGAHCGDMHATTQEKAEDRSLLKKSTRKPKSVLA